MKSKSILRNELLKMRRSLTQKRREEAAEKLMRTLPAKLAPYKNILSFSNMEGEIDLFSLNLRLAHEGRLLLPRLEKGDELQIYQVSDLMEDLTVHPEWKLLEPNPERCRPISFEEISCVLVPALGFDPNHHRLGYGKGHFDRFLSMLSCPFFGVGFKEQLLTKPLPIESHDIQLTEVFSY